MLAKRSKTLKNGTTNTKNATSFNITGFTWDSVKDSARASKTHFQMFTGFFYTPFYFTNLKS